MRTRLAVFVLLLAALAGIAWSRDGEASILIVTGGHEFEQEAFFDAFRAMDGITWRHASYGGEAEKLLSPKGAREFDVIVFYDMNDERGDWQQDWMQLFENGKPAVFLHHALGSYPDWHHYIDIVGGHANFGDRVIPGMPNTKYKHDEIVKVHVADPENPITRGMKDFEIHDEVYKDYLIKPGVSPLLSTNHPDSDHIIAWTHRYPSSAIVYIGLGHGPEAYGNPNFRELVRRSILWAAGRLAETDLFPVNSSKR